MHVNDIDPQVRDELGHRLLQSIRRIVRRISVHSREMAAVLGCSADGHDKPMLQLHNAYGGPIGNRFAFVGRQLQKDGDVIPL